MRVLRALFLPSLLLLYLAHVFQIHDPRFHNSGLAYWLDPYFINVLLEHWSVSLLHAADPASPPMFYPVPKTLGYSHGLVLFVPFYAPLRLFLHPFQAYNWTMLLVVAVGIVCLYYLFRKLGLSLVESVVIAALFFTSRNVMNEPASAWTQRLSVFLIPPILLLLLVSARMPRGPLRIVLAAAGGLLATLLYVQDFYTAHFAFLFVAAAAAAAGLDRGVRPAGRMMRAFWHAQTRASIAALALALSAGAWTAYLLTTGGGKVRVFGTLLQSTDWRRPAVVATVAAATFLWLHRRRFTWPRIGRPDAWWAALAAGAAAGALVFLWIYLDSYRQHRAFPEEHLLQQLLVRDPSTWNGPLDVLGDLDGYDSRRSFVLVPLLALIAWLPWARAPANARFHWLGFFALSVLVLLVPLRFPEFSLWRMLIEPLPGFRVIRDPKRIIYLYELAVALATAVFVARLPPKTPARTGIVLLATALIVTSRGPTHFYYRRPNAVYDRFVAAPVAVDASCRSFYIKVASEEYMSRSDHMWSIYGIDALFISLHYGIPTLNGYSAWVPDGWALFNPHEPEYGPRVTGWIERHALERVCELDIDARTMKPVR
jgi:hypothetical protein